MTPPVRDRSGNMWPGRARSDGRVAGSSATRTVAARSLAEMPVLVCPLASIDTQNAVSNRELFCDTISGISSSSRRSGVIERQMRPRPYLAMKLIASGVIFSAAIVRSPSFSRFASSTTMTILPARMDSTASSIGANGLDDRRPLAILICRFMGDLSRPDVRQIQPGKLDGSRYVFPDHVAFEVDGVAHRHATEVRVLHRVRHDLDVEAIVAKRRDRQADPIHGNRSLVHHERCEPARKRHGEPVEVGV